jgi:hypothetical protein
MAKAKTNTGLPKDHTGKIFGRLTALKKIKRKYSMYECLCSCGTKLEVRASGLVTGNTKSCGCLNKEKLRTTRAVDYTGQVFGKLTAIERIMLPNKGVKYRCLCLCGKETLATTGSLQSGNIKSCGCFNIEEIIKRNHDPELILKRMKSASDSSIKIHWKDNSELICKGGWEPRIIDYLNSNKVNYKWQVPFKLLDTRTYIVDFFDEDRNIYVEIKGWWRDDAKEKYDLFKSTYPNLICEVWGKKELQERNIALRSSKMKQIYLLTGAPASGKSWVLKSLPVTLTPIDSDIISKSKLVEEIDKCNNIPVVALTIGVSTFIKNNPQFEIKLIVIQEEYTILQQRMVDRGGKITPTIEKRVKRMKQLAVKAVFAGTSVEVLEYLSNKHPDIIAV